MKKTIARFLMLSLTVSLSACAAHSMPGPETPVTLNMWHVYGSQTKSPLNTVINEFNETVGSEYGITVNVVSVTSSSAIDAALAASAHREPGAEVMPDLFTAYPRVVEIVGEETLLPWDRYFTEEELSGFAAEFLSEGYFDSGLLMLPIAKSAEAFYLNKTCFDRFSLDTGITIDSLGTFDGVFAAARAYYDWSGGQNFFQINDFYNYAYIGMKALGSEFVRNGRLRLDDDAFRKLWTPLAETAIYGGVCLEDGYAASRWKTMEIIANTGSTADVLYQPTEIIHSDNTTEAIESISLPYPVFTEDTSAVVYRGGGLFAVKSEDERKNQAAYLFAKWLVEEEHNLDFVTNSGYLPVTDGALDTLFEHPELVENPAYRGIYETVNVMLDDYTFYALPLYHGTSETQSRFEENVKAVLKSAHQLYRRQLDEGADLDILMDTLIEESLSQLKSLSE